MCTILAVECYVADFAKMPVLSVLFSAWVVVVYCLCVCMCVRVGGRNVCMSLVHTMVILSENDGCFDLNGIYFFH